MRVLSILVVALLAAYVVAQSCPNNCSGHGTCNRTSRVCSCTGQWKGDDCSIWMNDLPERNEVRGTVQFRSWVYYQFTNQNGRAYKLTLTQVGSGDADMYVRKNEIPDLSHFDYSDVSTDRVSSIEVARTGQTTTWFVGIFGFAASDFTIKLEYQQGNCLDNCNDHGTCNNGQCICNAGWSGPTCATGVRDVQNNQWVSNIVLKKNEWAYYKYRVPGTSNFLRIEVVQRPAATADVDLFVRYAAIPTTEEWDYADAGVTPNITLQITEPQFGDWFIGFFGFGDETNFQFRVLSAAGECPNRCSLHGDCHGSTCSCARDYTGQTCNTLNRNLVQNENIVGYVDNNEWNYYKFVSNTQNNFMVEVWHAAGQDCDLYVNPGQVPTRFRYQYRDTGNDAHFTLRIDDPADQTWHIGIFGYSACQYNMTVYESSTCAQSCGTHGHCDQGHCVCNDGWAGENCDVAVQTITSSSKVTSTVTQNKWKYYKFVGTGSALDALIKEHSGNGVLWLFVGVNEFPSLANYDYSDTHPYNTVHKVSINWGREVTATYYIGVYGSPYVEQHEVTFDVVAWAPPF